MRALTSVLLAIVLVAGVVATSKAIESFEGMVAARTAAIDLAAQ